MSVVREQTFDVLRHHGMTTIFSNPGSTEVPLLTNLPDDFEFVLGLHESVVVGMATGWAIARNDVGVALLHTTAGLGNAVGAIATARVNRTPLVVLVGQQDRRHLAYEPFLTGERLELLAGTYPVWTDQPTRPQDVASSILRARHEAQTGRGPALVIVPMDDWESVADGSAPLAAPHRLYRATHPPPEAIQELAEMLDHAKNPVIVVGAGADDQKTWTLLVRLAESLGSPVWQEAFGARAGFPQDHPLFAGHLPARRSALRAALAGHDVVLCVGAAAFRQYVYEPGLFVEGDTQVAVVVEDADDAHHSAARLAVVASPAAVCAELLRHSTSRAPKPDSEQVRPAPAAATLVEPTASVSDVLDALALRIPPDSVLIEESPSSRPELQARVPARHPLGFLSAAMGGLGFAMPAAIGLRMAAKDRAVVAVVGDGSSLYSIQSLWSAVHYEVGVLFVVLRNNRYAIMDELARRQGGRGPWPDFAELDICRIATGLGCEAIRADTALSLGEILDSVMPTLAARRSPLLIDVNVAPSS